jgi:hypothetical protein
MHGTELKGFQHEHVERPLQHVAASLLAHGALLSTVERNMSFEPPGVKPYLHRGSA